MTQKQSQDDLCSECGREMEVREVRQPGESSSPPDIIRVCFHCNRFWPEINSIKE